jgi:Tfp pilus assembly protein PilN
VQIKSEVTQISAIGRDKRKLSNILACLAKALPDSVRFNSISIQKDSAKITGTASQYKDLPGFVDTLRKDAQFNRVTLQDIDRDRSVAKDRYSYTILFKLN